MCLCVNVCVFVREYVCGCVKYVCECMRDVCVVLCECV